MNSAIIMPVLNPDEKMIIFLDSLLEAGFKNIIIVNDGSKAETVKYFDRAAEHPEVKVLTHEVNKGKGAGLKTAFAYLATERPDIEGAITVDGDGQHNVRCINNCLEKFAEHPDAVIIGGRDFSSENIPARSRFGNRVSSVIYKYAVGIKLKDTQTGLRVIPSEYFEEFSKISGERYEYETNMLITIANRHIPYFEVPIETIYIDDNASSHFNPIKDSIKIYVVVLKYFFKFILSSLTSWVVDIGFYWIILSILESVWSLKDSIGESSSLAAALLQHTWNRHIAAVLIATIGARVISSIVNFILNRKVVFKNVDNLGQTVRRYFTLAVCQMILSFLLVDLLTNGVFHVTGFLNVLIKCVVDIVLFIFSYGIQRKWVFKNKKA